MPNHNIKKTGSKRYNGDDQKKNTQQELMLTVLHGPPTSQNAMKN